MTLREQYESTLAAWRTAHSQFLSDRLTLSRKEAQMHEADVEQDEAVADYFANRKAEMAARVAADEARMNTLATEAEEVRIAMVTEELDATLSTYRDTLRAVTELIATLGDQVAQIASLSQHAEELAGTLPKSAERQHRAADEVAALTQTIIEALGQLRSVVAPPEPAKEAPR